MQHRAIQVLAVISALSLTGGCLDELQNNPSKLAPLSSPVNADGKTEVDVRFQVLNGDNKGINDVPVYLLLPNLDDAAFLESGAQKQSLSVASADTEVGGSSTAGVVTAKVLLRTTSTTSVAIFAVAPQPNGPDGGPASVITAVLEIRR